MRQLRSISNKWERFSEAQKMVFAFRILVLTNPFVAGAVIFLHAAFYLIAVLLAALRQETELTMYVVSMLVVAYFAHKTLR
jgi:hypothetical protein